ncbi:EamA-like transporter family protein [Litorimonas haliclonae]
MTCCLFWGGNFVVGAWALGNNPVPPFMLAAVRAAIVLVFMGVFLFKPLPEKFGLLLIVGLCVGAIHLGFLYTGLQTASASGTSILSQTMIPLATLMSVFFLKEKIGRIRTGAIVAAFIGVCIMVYEPGGLSLDINLVYIFIAYVSLALGSVLMRKVGNIDWRIYVSWMSLLLLLASGAASILFESGQVTTFKEDGVPLIIAAAYGAVFVSIFSHGQYFRLLQSYDVAVIVPLTIMTTVFATILGILLLDETLEPRYIIGAAIILPCVYVIARRQKSSKSAPKMMES